MLPRFRLRARTCLEVRHLKLKYGNLFWVTDEKGNEDIIYIGKTDIKSAFHLLPLKRSSYNWVVMKAVNPTTGKTQYFIDKCLSFGASISCAHFQRFSNALKHLVQFRTAMNTVKNYLDDFLFAAATLLPCNYFICEFLQLCLELGVPIVKDKTVWATLRLVFLGILLDCTNMTSVIPEEKRIHDIYLIKSMLDKTKATIRELQQLCGYLNFLNQPSSLDALSLEECTQNLVSRCTSARWVTNLIQLTQKYVAVAIEKN